MITFDFLSLRIVTLKILGVCLAWIISGTPAAAEILFEGYSKILAGDTHIGYTIQRYEFDPKAKEMISAYYIRTGKNVGDVTESLVARGDQNYRPIKYSYTLTKGPAVQADGTTSAASIKTIDAQFDFKKAKLALKVSDGGRLEKRELDLSPDTQLSTFVGYLMLRQGLKAPHKYLYKAIAEEDGQEVQGQALIQEQTQYRGLPVFKVINEFRGERFLSYLTPKGDVLRTSSPVKNLSTELVANPDDATKGFEVSARNLTKIFGEVPKGHMNALSVNQKTQGQQPASPQLKTEPQSKPQPKTGN